MLIPYVTEDTAKGERSMDIYSRLLADRIIFLGTEINDQVANNIVSQLIFLGANDPKKPIMLYINSPGGSIASGLAIFDTMRYLGCEIHTYCIGMGASMAALLLAAGTKGKRFVLPHSRVMLHQPSGAIGGTSKDIEIQAREVLHYKKILAKLFSDLTGQDLAKIIEDSERDYYMSADEALKYGLIDNVLKNKAEMAMPALQKG